METINYTILLFRDSQGNKQSAVVEEGFDKIQICGLKDANGNEVHFGSENYHAKNWCKENGIEMRQTSNYNDFDQIWENAYPSESIG